ESMRLTISANLDCHFSVLPDPEARASGARRGERDAGQAGACGGVDDADDVGVLDRILGGHLDLHPLGPGLLELIEDRLGRRQIKALVPLRELPGLAALLLDLQS